MKGPCDWRERYIQKTPFDIRLGVMLPEDASMTDSMVNVVSYDCILHYKVVGSAPLNYRFLGKMERSLSRLSIPGVKKGMCIISPPSMLLHDKLDIKYQRRVTISLNAMYSLDTPCKANCIPRHITDRMINEITRVWNEIAEESGLEPIRNKYQEKKKKGGALPLASMRKVIQYDTDGKEVGRYNSVTEAADAINVSRGAVTKVLTGRMEKCKGFIFKYA